MIFYEILFTRILVLQQFFLLLSRLNKLLLCTYRLITHKNNILFHDHTVFTGILNFMVNTLFLYFSQCYQHYHNTGSLLDLELLKKKNHGISPSAAKIICYFQQSLFSCSLPHSYFQYLRMPDIIFHSFIVK